MELTHTELIIKQCQLQKATKPEDYVNFAIAYTKTLEELMRGEWQYICIEDIRSLGYLIEPEQNLGFRTTPVHFANMNFAINAASINRALESWREAYNKMRLSPDELYKEFEEIHPFNDGNGRVGHIIWAMATYRQKGYWPMELPPDLFNSSNIPATPV